MKAKARAKIGAQMYTVREFCKTPADIATSLKKIKAMGYDGVQLSALGPIDPRELKKMLEGEGLVCAATHISLDRMKNEPQAVIEDHKLWGCRYPAVGGFFKESFTRQDWLDYAKTFSEVGKTLAAGGLALGYHNHSHELQRFEGKTALDLLLEHCDPTIWMEIDTYWIQHGGGDPAAWIEKVKGRIPCVHFKDMGITAKREQVMCEIGAGNLNWPRILKACKTAGVEWYLVERDAGELDAFDSLKVSLENMRQMGL